MAPPPPRDRALLKRVLSALVMIPPVLAAVWFGPPWSDLLVGVATAILACEWVTLSTGRLKSPAAFCFVAGLVGAIVLGACGLWPWTPLPIGLAAAFATPLAAPRHWPWYPLGLLYLAPPTLAFLALRDRPEDGLEVICFLLAVVWATDIFAYFVGKTLGGPKLWPAVSPKKTWSGLAGGMVFAALAGAAAAWWLSGWPVWQLALAGAVLAVVSQGGDLLESAVKRHFGAKDASHLIPGHGGLLDRVDGLLAASLALAIALWLAQQ